MQPRRIARELALLGMSQVSDSSPEVAAKGDLETLLSGAIATLTSEAKELLETASAELTRGDRHLLESETRAAALDSARDQTQAAITQVQTAINRLGIALELPQFIQLGQQREIETYALHILQSVTQNLGQLDQTLNDAMVGWNLKRLARVDRDILRIALTEIMHLGLDKRIAIDEAIEVAKRYSDEDGYRFINGVMRRVTDRLGTAPA